MRIPALLVLFATCLAAQPPASVEGTVVNSVTGDPVRYAHVGLVAGEKKYGAMATADGRFSISPLAPGSYQVSASANGYLPLDTQPLALQPGDRKQDFALKLTPAAAIAGRVVDDGGNPAEGFKVTAIRGSADGFGRTNDQGEFRIAGLRAGKYLLRASPERENGPPEFRSDGSKEIYYGPAYYPGVVSAPMALAVEARAGAETSGIEIRLVRQPIVRVSGSVTGAAPKDRWNAQVLAGKAGGVRLQPDGSFLFWRLPPGPNRLMAEFSGPADQSWRSAPLDIVVGDTDIDHLELRIVPPFEIAGKVEDWSGKTGKLTLRPLDGSDPIDAEIAADGQFRLKQVQPDFYRIAIAELPENTWLKRVRLGAIDMPDGILDVRGGVSGDPLSIQLATGAARVIGTVSDANLPLAGALVALFPDGPHANELRLLVHARSDGAYSIGGLAPGKYAILALPAGEPETVARYDAKLEKLELGEGESANHPLTIAAR